MKRRGGRGGGGRGGEGRGGEGRGGEGRGGEGRGGEESKQRGEAAGYHKQEFTAAGELLAPTMHGG